MRRIPRIVITGGPCAGKTSVLAVLKEKLMDLGFAVYIAHEAATELMQEGVPIAEVMQGGDTEKIIRYQSLIIESIMRKEALLEKAAQLEVGNAVILCDRGVIDVRAYFPKGNEGTERYLKVLDRCNTGPQSIVEMYDGVVKLTTAADGASEHYTSVNNIHRKETPEQAIELDRRIEEAYLESSELSVKVIDNSTDFEGKKRRTIAEVCQMLAMPVPLEIELKFLVEQPSFQWIGAYRETHIEQTYLSAPLQEQRRVRKRTRGLTSTFYLTSKRKIGSGRNEEREQMISEAEYEQYLRDRDPERHTIRKIRRCFIYHGQFFELDEFLNVAEPLWVLEIERTDADRPDPIFPPWMTVIREVTDDPRYSNHQIALRALPWYNKRPTSV